MGIAPGSFGKPRLATKMAEKLFRLRQLIPDLGQEGSPRLTIGEYHPVNAWAQFPDQVFPIGILKKGSRGENRDIDSHPVQFLRNQGRKTEIMEGGMQGIPFNTLDKSIRRFDISYASPQLSSDFQGHKRAALPAQSIAIEDRIFLPPPQLPAY